MFDHDNNHMIVTVTGETDQLIQFYSDSQKEWAKQIPGVSDGEPAKLYSELEAKVNTLKVYCSTVQAANLILNTVKEMKEKSDKRQAFENFMESLAPWGIQLGKGTMTWLRVACDTVEDVKKGKGKGATVKKQ